MKKYEELMEELEYCRRGEDDVVEVSSKAYIYYEEELINEEEFEEISLIIEEMEETLRS